MIDHHIEITIELNAPEDEVKALINDIIKKLDDIDFRHSFKSIVRKKT